MVKGISRQVILVRSPDPELFEQAIFILKEGSHREISDEQLLKEATGLMSSPERAPIPGLIWALLGAAATGAAWLLTACVF